MPKFETPIRTDGPNGNTLMILGAATSMMRQLDVPRSDIAALRDKVFAADSYGAAMDAIRAWFPLDTDDDA